MKLKNIFSFATFATIVSVTAAFAAGPSEAGVCALVTQLKSVFGILRTLAFIGAAFVIAAWGWDALTAKEYKWADDGKKRLIAMIIGFALLFSVGLILQFLTGGAGCAGGIW